MSSGLRARVSIMAVLLLAAATVTGTSLARPEVARGQSASAFPVTVGPACIAMGSTITVSATNVSLGTQHAPTAGAGVNSTGWDTKVQIMVGGSVLSNAFLTPVVPPGQRVPRWDLVSAPAPLPAGLRAAQTVEVRHQHWNRFVFGSGFYYYVDTWASGFASITISYTCSPSTSVAPACLGTGGGAMVINGQVRSRQAVDIVMDGAVTVASKVPVDSNGFFKASMRIPPVAVGTHTLQVGSGPPGDFSPDGAPTSFAVPCTPPSTTSTSTTSTSTTTTTTTTLPSAPAALAVAPTSADVGSLTVGQPSAPVMLTITNVGESPTTMASAALLGGPNPNDASITIDTCPNALLGPGASCAVTVVATPADSGSRVFVVGYASVDPSVVPVASTITATASFGTSIVAEPNVVQATHGVVCVHGSGFPPSATLLLSWTGFVGTVTAVADASGSFTTVLMVPAHFIGGPLEVKVADQLPRFSGPSDDVLVRASTGRPAGVAPLVTRQPFWRG